MNSVPVDHVHVLTLGGTIDKDYPKLTSGYAFEFGEKSAAERILKNHPNLSITYTFKSICKKDSLQITQQVTTDFQFVSTTILVNRAFVQSSRQILLALRELILTTDEILEFEKVQEISETLLENE